MAQICLINPVGSIINLLDLNWKINKDDVFGEVAITTFYNKYSFIKNNIRVQGKVRVTLVFFKTEEGWKIVHEHSSPFDQ